VLVSRSTVSPVTVDEVELADAIMIGSLIEATATPMGGLLVVDVTGPVHSGSFVGYELLFFSLALIFMLASFATYNVPEKSL